MSFKDDIDQENILELQHILNQFRKRAEKVGLTEILGMVKTSTWC